MGKKLTVISLSFVLIGLILIVSGLSFNSSKEPPRKPDQKVASETAETSSLTPKVVAGISGDRALVTHVVDGDTIEISMVGKDLKVRYIGIDTPETVDPRRPVGCFGKEASNANKQLVEGKEVVLEKDVTDTDKFNRLLRYVYLPLDDGRILFVNDYLVREGFARVYTYPPDVKYNERFLDAERQARELKKGLWSKC